MKSNNKNGDDERKGDWLDFLGKDEYNEIFLNKAIANLMTSWANLKV